MFYYILLSAADGHSIYIKGLPLTATVSVLAEEFKKFGPIKNGGIQVRSNRVCNCWLVYVFFSHYFSLYYNHLSLCIATGILLWLCGIWGGKCCAKSNWGVPTSSWILIALSSFMFSIKQDDHYGLFCWMFMTFVIFHLCILPLISSIILHSWIYFTIHTIYEKSVNFNLHTY